MSTEPKYAPEGMIYLSVETPSVFKEILVHESWADQSIHERRLVEKLEDLAERHGTHVCAEFYRKG